MGLLDAMDSPDMAMAMGLLGAGGYSRMPVSTGQGIAQGYGAYQQAKQQQQAQQQSKEMFDIQKQQHQMQLAQAQRSQAEQAAAKANLTQYVAQMPDGPQKQQIVQAVQMGVPMKDVWDKLNPKQEAYTLAPGAQRFGADNQPLNSVPVKPDPLPWYVQKGPNGTQIDPAYAQFEKAKAMSGRPVAAPTPYFTSVNDATKGMGTFDNRTGKYSFDSAAPLVNPKNSPILQGEIAGAKVAGEAKAKRTVNMSGLGSVISTAEDLLTGKAGALPTGSPLGAGIDAAAGFFGASPSGASEAQQLKSLAGALTSKMPRMEGPQSDKDVQLYREMAADIGNQMLPRARRVAALKTVKELYSKYDATAGSEVSAPPSAVKFLGFE